MRAKPVNADEQYRLIMECRASGLTDYQWCIEHGIKPGTFYNWVKRLRQKGCDSIPSAVKSRAPVRQEIVKIDLQKPSGSILEIGKRKINQRIEKILQFLYTVIRTANILIYIVPEQSAMTFLFQGANSARAVSVILVLGRRSSR